MAANFQLINKVTGQAGYFNAIDEEICAAFGWPMDEENYIFGWYNAIGWRVATGNSLDQVRSIFIGYIIEALLKNDYKQVRYYTTVIGILNYLTQHYTTDSWYTVGK
jgi:hypothetical protein